MKRSKSMVLASALFCLGCVVLYGCSGAPEDTSDEGLVPAARGGAAVDLLKELEYKDVGTITGTVTFDGNPPDRPILSGVEQHADHTYCMQGDVTDPTWIVNPGNKGVANVVVWVAPPTGTYFKKPDDKYKTWQDTPTVDQPFCAFQPHVSVLYPQYYNGKELAATGQVMKVVNSAKIGHNIKMAGSSDKNPALGATLTAGTGTYLFSSVRVDNRPLSLNCDVHKWMTGYALTFDHPYAAVTDADGKFTIKNVPAGTELTFWAWHEALNRFVPAVEGGAKIKLDPNGTKTLNFTVTKK
jgi:hypothetical protein